MESGGRGRPSEVKIGEEAAGSRSLTRPEGGGGAENTGWSTAGPTNCGTSTAWSSGSGIRDATSRRAGGWGCPKRPTLPRGPARPTGGQSLRRGGLGDLAGFSGMLEAAPPSSGMTGAMGMGSGRGSWLSLKVTEWW